VRIPSAWNDLVGLKTTSGRLSLEGVVPLCETFDTVGPLCRTVEDAALLLAVLEGGNAADLRGASLKGMRLAQIDTVGMEALRDAPKAAFVAARDALRSAGATIEMVEAPELAEAMALTGVLFTGEAYGQWRDVIEANPQLMFKEILERFRAGASFSAPEYAAAWKKLEACRRRWHARMAGYDAVICPSSPILPPNRKRLIEDHDYYVSENLLALRNTRIGNLMGLSSLTLPTGVPSCGIMFMARPMAEERLLRLGRAAEEALS
jgi:aspartyl-tRNA(Asn)/glutamyl-tRNA(Gln) amidotransferase subunit A